MFETPKVTTSEENNESTEVGFPPDTTPKYHSKAKMKGKDLKINEEDEYVDEVNQEDVEETNQEEKNGVITQEQDTEIEQEEQDPGVSQEGPITEINQDIQKKYHTIQESQEYQTTQDYGDDITQEPQEYQPSPQNPFYNQYQQGPGYIVLPAIRNKPIIQSKQTNEINPLKIYKEIQYGQQFPDYQNFQEIGNSYEYQYNQYNQYQYVAQSPEYQQNQYYLQNAGYYQQNQFNGFSEEQTNNRYNYSPEISQTSQNISETNNTKEVEVKERKKKKSQPKDSLSKVYIPSRSGKKFLEAIASMKKKQQSKYNKAQKTSSKTETSSTTSNKISKTKFNFNKEKMSEYVEIPRNEYKKYANNLTLVLEGGINTGKYKFSGNESIVEEDISGRKYKLSEQEIEDEIIRRYREKKKVKYEICDKFISLFEYDREALKKLELRKYEKELEKRRKNNSDLQGNIYRAKTEIIQSKTKNERDSDIHYGNSLIYKNKLSMFPKDEYSLYILDQINRIRIDPQLYIGPIQRAKFNIVNSRNGEIFYNGKVKIALFEGELAFDKAIAVLRNTESMQKLMYSPQLTVELPKTEAEIRDRSDLKKKVSNMVHQGINIKSYWRSNIKDPETSFLSMIVDDNEINSGMRRKDILNPNMKYIGISSIEINGKFVCYLTLSSSVYNFQSNKK